MPIFDQGYRPYEGGFRGRTLLWWRISLGCFRTVKRWPLVVLLVAGAFPLVASLLQVYAISAAEGPLRQIAEHLEYGYGDGTFYELLSTQIFFVVLLLMVVGSGQIAEDFRTGALQIYFSKPITHLDYVLGKLGTVVLAASLLTAVPSVILFGACVLFSPDWTFLAENPFLLPKALAFSAVISLFLGALVLAVSSLGRRGRMVGLVFAGGYFFTMMLGHAIPRIFRVDGHPDARLEVVHLGRCLDAVGATIFSEGSFPDASPGVAWAILAALFLLSILLLARKVRAVEVVS